MAKKRLERFRKQGEGKTVRIPMDRYLRIRAIAESEGRTISFLLGKAIDLFLVGYTVEK
jgi:hypothetical protein